MQAVPPEAFFKIEGHVDGEVHSGPSLAAYGPVSEVTSVVLPPATRVDAGTVVSVGASRVPRLLQTLCYASADARASQRLRAHFCS